MKNITFIIFFFSCINVYSKTYELTYDTLSINNKKIVTMRVKAGTNPIWIAKWNKNTLELVDCQKMRLSNLVTTWTPTEASSDDMYISDVSRQDVVDYINSLNITDPTDLLDSMEE